MTARTVITERRVVVMLGEYLGQSVVSGRRPRPSDGEITIDILALLFL